MKRKRTRKSNPKQMEKKPLQSNPMTSWLEKMKQFCRGHSPPPGQTDSHAPTPPASEWLDSTKPMGCTHTHTIV